MSEQSASASPKLARIRDVLIAVVSTGGLAFHFGRRVLRRAATAP